MDKGSGLLFVCYGNICRSPMALGLAEKLLGDGYYIESAGTGALTGSPAAAQTIEVMKEYGVDISGHRAKNIRDMNMDRFDLIVALSAAVRDVLRREYPRIEQKTILWEIPDPIGYGIDIYRRCADQIESKIKGLGL